MAKKLNKRVGINPTTEPDSVYFLKLLLFFILGLIWFQYQGKTILPAGLILGLIFASHDHFKIDKKIEYAVLLVASLMGLAGFGIIMNFM